MTQGQLIKKIPRTSGGKIRNERLREIEKLLSWYTYGEQELRIIEQEIAGFCVRYGHAGRLVPRSARR